MNASRWISILSLAALLQGCSTRVLTPSSRLPKMGPRNFVTVRVFFATDRDLTSNTKPGEMFDANRSKLIRYGTCDVRVPSNRELGEIKDFVLLKPEIQFKEKYFSDLAEKVSRSPKKNAFIFIHGYNVSFADAAKRTAQISYDLRFKGAAVFYSWPSQNAAFKYTIDESNIEWTEAHLKSFLEDFLSSSEASDIYVIAHSMGTRALTRAFVSLIGEKPEARQRFRELILAAPDIDAEVFKRDIAPVLSKSGQAVTLYASKGDRALSTSKGIHGYARAGDARDGLVVVPGIETIDATSMDTSFFGHSYYVEMPTVLADISCLIHKRLRANQRSHLKSLPAGYWEFWQKAQPCE